MSVKHKGSWWALTNQGVQWDGDKPYYNTSDGMRDYIPPVAAMQYTVREGDPPEKIEEAQRMQAYAAQHGSSMEDPGGSDIRGQGLLHHRSQWNSQKGKYEEKFDWGNLMAMGIGGMIAAPVIAGVAGAAGAGAAGGGGAAAGGGAGAAGAGAAGGGVLASSSIPAASLMGGAGAVGTGATVGGAAAGGGVLAGGAIPAASGSAAAAPALSGATSTGALGAGGGTATASGAGGSSLMSKLLSKDTIGAVGSGINSASQAAANNRGEQFGGEIDLERLLMDRDKQYQDMRIAREQEGRTSGSDAWRKLLAAQHTLSPGDRPKLSPYSIAPRQTTESERQGADAMTKEVMARLQGGNPIEAPTQRPINVDPELLKAGKGEKIGGIVGPILSGIGGIWGGGSGDYEGATSNVHWYRPKGFVDPGAYGDTADPRYRY